MFSRISPLILLLLPALAGCVAEAETAPEEEPQAAASPETPAPPPTDPYADGDGYQSPCVTGEVLVLNGAPVWVPVPCRRETIDKGDPPPFEQAPHDPSVIEKKSTTY